MFRALPDICHEASLQKCKLLKTLNYFQKKAPSYIFERVLKLSEIILPNWMEWNGVGDKMKITWNVGSVTKNWTAILIFFLILLEFTPCKAEQPLQTGN